MEHNKSRYLISRLNEVLSKSNLQPTLRELERKHELISRSIKNVENSHAIIRENLKETKINLKKREDLFWKRCDKVETHSSSENTDDDEPMSPLLEDNTSCVIENKMSGLQIDLSVLSPEDGAPDSPPIVSLLTPISPPVCCDATSMFGSSLAKQTIPNLNQSALSLRDGVLVMRRSKNWSKGVIVHCHPCHKLFNVRGDGFFEKSIPLAKLCLLREMAAMSVGNRIVALYGHLDIFYAGVVAETTCEENGDRILVFFDDGFAQYLCPENVYLVANICSEVWEEVGKMCRDFIKEYLDLYPRRRMIRLKTGDDISTEWRGKWCVASVVAVDCSLARVHFVEQNIHEWIYRGSTRFMTLFDLSATTTTTTTTDLHEQTITMRDNIITNMLFDDLCPFCLEVSDTNTGLMESGTMQELGVDVSTESDTMEMCPSEEPKTDELTNQDTEDSVSDYDSAEGSDPDSEYTECVSTRTKASVPYSDLLQDTETADESAVSYSSRRRWRNIIRPNLIQAPRIGWEPGTIAAGSSLIDKQNEYQRAVLFNNHSYQFSAQFDQSLEILALEESVNFWLNETAKLELKCAKDTLSGEVLEHHIVSGLSQPFEECILSEHSYSRFSSPNRATQARKSPSRVTLGDPEARIFRRIIRENEFTSQENIFTPHECGSDCSSNASLSSSLHPINILSIPIFLGWKRELSFQPHKTKPVHVYYLSPCKRRLRSLDEIEYYIHITDSRNVSIDMFCLDTSTDIQNCFVSFNSPKLFVGDLTLGIERIPIPFINELDTKPLPPLHYTTKRICYPGININTNNEHMICCDCTDNCQDKTKCACCLLTAEVSKYKDFYGYQNRRLISTCGVAIYECNKSCRCSSNCSNRVIQNGIQARLHVFKTENKGWGIRCIDDIPKGAFICTYAGYIYNDELANERGVDFGDDYLAELDYLDVMETKKEGYEPYYGALQQASVEKINNEIVCKTDSPKTTTTTPTTTNDKKICLSNPARFLGHQDVILLDSHSESDAESSASEQQLEETVVETTEIMVECDESEALIESTKLGMIEDRFSKEWCNIALEMTKGDVSLAAEFLEKADTLVTDSDPYTHPNPKEILGEYSLRHNRVGYLYTFLVTKQLLQSVSKARDSPADNTSEPTSDMDLPFIAQVQGSLPEHPMNDQPEILVISDEDDLTPVIQETYSYPQATPPPATCDTYCNIRSLHAEKGAYVMDAKFVGNIGRYFNHSCQPNIFTHTVFLDTHDLRFPWVAFFAKKRIKANTELTWDYNYEIGSVPNKVLQCLCGAPKCRGRLL